MLRCSSADAREDRILLKQAHYSQYNIRRGKPTETERGRGTVRPPKDGPGAGGKGGPGGSGGPGGAGAPGGPNGPDPT
jgi:hypothetical protein